MFIYKKGQVLKKKTVKTFSLFKIFNYIPKKKNTQKAVTFPMRQNDREKE